MAHAFGSSAQWITEVAKSVLATGWDGLVPEEADTVVFSLSQLPPSLLADVMQECRMQAPASESGQPRSPLAAVFACLVPAIHPAFDSNEIASHPAGHLDVTPDDADRVLSLLPYAAAQHMCSGLQSLHVAKFQNDMRPGTAGLLARAIAAQPSLTSLQMSKSVGHEALGSFAACLTHRALPHLVNLSIDLDSEPGSSAQIGLCLRHMPALTKIFIRLAQLPQPARTVESLSAYTRLAATPAHLPALRDLAVIEVFELDDDAMPEYSRSYTSSGVPALFGVIDAPALTSLFLDCGVQPAETLNAIVQRLARFPALQEVCINSDNVVHFQPPFVCATPPRAAASLSKLHALTRLDVRTCGHASAVSSATAFADLATTSLKSLAITVPPVYESRVPSSPRSEMAAWRAWQLFYPVMGRLTGLTELSLTCTACVLTSGLWLDHPRDGDNSALGVASSALIQELRKLSALEKLNLDLSDCSDYELAHVSDAVASACEHLTGLTELKLCMSPGGSRSRKSCAYLSGTAASRA